LTRLSAPPGGETFVGTLWRLQRHFLHIRHGGST
jgi:hypothetical protein